MGDFTPPWERFYPEGVKADFTPRQGHVCDRLLESIEENADRVAIDYRSTEITYRELGQQIGRVSNALRKMGVGPDVTVGLYLPNSPYHPYFFYGTLMTGARIAHLSPLDAPRELAFKCTDSGARIIVTLTIPHFVAVSKKLKEQGVVDTVILCEDAVFGGDPMPDADFPEAIRVEDMLDGADPTLVKTERALDDVALLQYTGGTTGRPKAAALSHGNLTAGTSIFLEVAEDKPWTGKNAIVLVTAPLFHIMALTANMMPRLAQGAKLILRQRFEIAQTIDDIEQKKVNAFGGVPTMWIALLNFPGIEKRDLSSLKSIGSGGAPCPPEVGTQVSELIGQRLRGGWGMTETGSTGTILPETAPESKHGSIGIPLPSLRLEIVDVADPTRVLPNGETGEMRIKGRNILNRYWNNPEETERSFVDGWFLTGDIGRMDDDGFFYLVDRKKDLILSGGFNVYPQAIEDAIHEHSSVAEVLVIGVPDSYRGEAAKAFVVLKDGKEPFSIEDLRAFLDDKLGRHELPQYVEFRTELPRTAVGKYSRKLLRDLELNTTA